jgi:RAD50-interacting protein 1
MEPSTTRDPSPMAVLIDPKNDIPVGERDIRLEDYLNDKIQTKVDLGNLASLIATVDLQKKQLDQQVTHAILLNSGAIWVNKICVSSKLYKRFEDW